MMGRLATTLTEQQRSEVETLAAVLTAEQMADYFGMGRTTFFSLMQRDPEIAARYKKGRARAVGSVAQSLITKARAGDTACMIFFLKTQGGWRETTRIEHLDNAAGQMIDITALSDAELEAVIAALSLTVDGDQAPGLPHPSPSA
jgi:hypothetical protein